MNSRRMKIASKIDIKMKVFNVHMDSWISLFLSRKYLKIKVINRKYYFNIFLIKKW
jgi:hypothetical protein